MSNTIEPVVTCIRFNRPQTFEANMTVRFTF